MGQKIDRRKIHLDREAESIGLEDSSIISLLNGYDEHAQTQALKKLLRRVIDGELTDGQKRVIYLYYYEKMTYEEIGAHLGITHQAVYGIINRAKARIKQVMQYWF